MWKTRLKNRSSSARLLPAMAAAALLAAAGPARAAQPCLIEVVEEGSGRPVPLVELRTVHNVRFVSDNAGAIAFDLPELLGRETWFYVEGHGYEVPKDGFGFRGVRLTPAPGGALTVKVRRTLPAKRLGRITGAGLFGESQKLGREAGWLEQGVLGCDSLQLAAYGGRLFWLWGDTNLSPYPLGIFHALGATTPLKPLESFEPPVRLRYDYFRDDKGAARAVAPLSGKGPTWLGGLLSLPEAKGVERLVAYYVKVDRPLESYESGLCAWNPESQVFERIKVLWTRRHEGDKEPPGPGGHAVPWKDEDGADWVLFGNPFPHMKCPATFEGWSSPAAWVKMNPQKTLRARSGEELTPHAGSIAWNGFRKKWVAVFTQAWGKPSALGEVWFAEAPAPEGPWAGAVKVVTHANYSFYNPRLHPELTPPDSPVLLFEGTYSTFFTDHANPAPRCDYNQVLYRLDLDEEWLKGE